MADQPQEEPLIPRLLASTGRPLPLIDVLFTATSAQSVTGLAVVDTGGHLSLFGQLVALLPMADSRLKETALLVIFGKPDNVAKALRP